MIAYFQAAWDDSPDTKIYIEAVHRLSEIGAVVPIGAWDLTRGLRRRVAGCPRAGGRRRDGQPLRAFDEADLDTAIARFDQLSRPATRLENAASHVYERFQACFAARDWAALADITADESTATIAVGW